MSDLEDLVKSSITDMSNDEAIEYLRQIRLNRRLPTKRSVKKPSTKKIKLSKEEAIKLLAELEN